ncbi:hypothetical protein FP744_10000852 [Trichoderma asperellum]|nr:hypothetical protein LI328DRAFT_142410 [Trichoderma asperelloides]
MSTTTDANTQGLFAPTLESDRLTYAIFDMKNEIHMQFTVDMFNHFMAGTGPTDGAWTKNDIRRLSFSLMMKPSDAHGRRPDTPCMYIPSLKTAPAIPIGIISFCRRTPDIPMDLGYVISPDYQRKGYGLEGSARISRYWKDEFGVKEMCIITTEDNIASRKLAEGNGYLDGGYVMKGDTKMVAYILPGMKKLEGQTFSMWGDGEIPEDDC